MVNQSKLKLIRKIGILLMSVFFVANAIAQNNIEIISDNLTHFDCDGNSSINRSINNIVVKQGGTIINESVWEPTATYTWINHQTGSSETKPNYDDIFSIPTPGVYEFKVQMVIGGITQLTESMFFKIGYNVQLHDIPTNHKVSKNKLISGDGKINFAFDKNSNLLTTIPYTQSFHFGLVSASQARSTYGYAFKYDASTQQLEMYNDGALISSSPMTYHTRDLLTIERNAGQIIFKKNDQNLHIISASSEDLYVKVDPTMSFSRSEFFTDFCNIIDPCSIEIQALSESVSPVQACDGKAVDLAIAPVDPLYLPTDYSNITWEPAAIILCNTCANTVALPTANTNITLTVNQFNSTACTATDAIDVEVNAECDTEPVIEEVIGCCFSNYGAKVYIGEGTELTVNCNVVNELGGIENGVIKKGEFLNKGAMYASEDWIHNAQNALFKTEEGNIELVGGDQKMRGSSSTKFYDLKFTGEGVKSLGNDQYTVNELDLENSELAIDNYTFHYTNTTPILKENGYVSTDGENGTGYLEMALSSSFADEALYPMGSKKQGNVLKYRPVQIESGAGSAAKVSFQNHNYTQDQLDKKASNVGSLNTNFYHKVDSDNPDLEITSYYTLDDGFFQALAHWDNTVQDPLWRTSFEQNALDDPIEAGEFAGYLITSTNNTNLSFNGEPYILSNGGFYIGTGNFGNPGTTITVNGENSTGGGLGGVDGTGGGTGAEDSVNTYAPNPVPGDYTIEINGNSECVEDGVIHFTVTEMGVVEDIAYELDPATTVDLSNEVYDIDLANSGLILNAEPKNYKTDDRNSEFKFQEQQITIQFGAGGFVYHTGDVVIKSSSDKHIRVNELRIKDKEGSVVATKNDFTNQNINENNDYIITNGEFSLLLPALTPTVSSKVYQLEMDFTIPSTSETFTIFGQFIHE